MMSEQTAKRMEAVMKKLIIIAALVVATAVPAMAQSSRYRNQRGGYSGQNYMPPGVSRFDQNMIDREAVPSSI
jgi:hypothetical protein